MIWIISHLNDLYRDYQKLQVDTLKILGVLPLSQALTQHVLLS